MIKRNRVVITGMGVVAPNGIGLEAFWDSLLNCRSGIGPITLFDASQFKSRIAGEVKNFDPLDYIEPELKPRRMARHTQLAYASAMMALDDAGLNLHSLKLPSPTPVIVGVSTSALDIIERVFHDVNDKSPNRVSPSALSASKPQAAANLIAEKIGTCAHAATVSAACPSGLDAVAIAAATIMSGEADIALAGGADAPITPLATASFIASGLCSANGSGEKASRPFDRDRESGVLAEGAGILVVENLERAEARGARIYAEITGYSRQRDPDPDNPGSGLAESMRIAMANAGQTINEIDFISAYGPGDPILDAIEVSLIKQVFGKRAYSIPVSSIKGVTGNPLAAGGPFQVAACVLAIHTNTIVPTANYESPDPQCDLDVVPNRPRNSKIDSALVNVRGLGGSASTLVVSRIMPDE